MIVLILFLCIIAGTFFGLGIVYTLRAISNYFYFRNLTTPYRRR